MELKDLHPNEQNPRKISQKQKEMMAKSLDQFGDVSGFVFNRRFQRLVAGHQKKAILPKDSKIIITEKYDEPNKHGTVAVGFVDIGGEKFKYREVDVDETTELAMNIASNKHSGEFDMAILPEFLLELDSQNIDMDLLGFSAEELENIMAPVGGTPGLTDEDAVPDVLPDDQRVKLGDLFVLGNHRLLCGDSTNKATVERLMNGEKADVTFTDPPYGVNAVGGSKAFGTVGGPEKHRNKIIKANVYKKIEGDDSTDTAIDSFALAQQFSADQIFWGAQCYAEALPPSQGWIVWDKDTTGNLGDGELAWTNQNRAIRIFKHTWNGLIKGSERNERRCHPTQKPIALAEWCLENYSKDGKSVLDLFGGSGSTLIACEKTKRKCFMMEIDPHYCAVILDRWAKFTGKDPVREDGKKWSEIEK